MAALCCLCAQAPSAGAAPTFDSAKQYAQARSLVQQEKYALALPLLEKVVKAQPNNAMAYYYLGFALVVTAQDVPDDAARRARRVRARNAWIRSKKLNVNEPNVDALIASIPADGSPAPGQRPFSSNAQANKLMAAAEEFYSSGKLDEALANYQKALKLDPKIYEAALFSGDVYLHRKDYESAETWYQKAIAIDPNRETAYRYSATPLMQQGKTDEARERYIEAYITEPYSRFTSGGLQQWAKASNNMLHDPTVPIPAKAVTGSKADGTFAWAAYAPTRATWRKQKFAQTFPREKIYRHSLPEEAAALRAVIKLAESKKTGARLEPGLARLKKLDDEGLLEPFILLTLNDEGIAQDHPEYLQQHRKLLRKFVSDYVVNEG